MYNVARQPRIHGNARVITAPEPSLQIAVETEDAVWSYAVSFELYASQSLHGTGEPRVVVDLQVEAGTFGVGCTTADYSSYVDREVYVPSGMRRKVYVPIGAPGAASHLILRNASRDGRSTARIHGIEICRATAAEEIAEQLRSSGPIGVAFPHDGTVVQAFGPRVSPPEFQPILIETDVPAYSNAASFGLTVPLELDGAGKPSIVVDLEVETGAVSIGCTTADYSSYVDREVYVPPGMRRKVYVPIGAPGAASQLMLRNDSLDGRSLARIHGIEIRRATAAEEIAEELRCFPPILTETDVQAYTNATSSRLTMPLEVDGAGESRVVVELAAEAKTYGPDRRIGGMATMPSRARTFEVALASILPQLDRLFIYFDKYGEVPRAFRDHPKIVPLLPSQHGELGTCGKFLGVQLHDAPCLYFCFDDDILYPPDYVEVMTRALYRHQLQAVIGVHASLLKPPYLSFRRDRDVVEFRKALAVDCCFDVLGTGTIAFHTGVFRPDPDSWRFKDMADIMVAIEAAKRGLPRISIRRPKNYLRPLDRQQSDSIYVRLVKDDTRETAIMRQALRSCSLSWSFSPIAPRAELSAQDLGLPSVFIDTTHGVVPAADVTLLTHQGLIDTDRFVTQIRNRERAYVPLDACLRGEGDALTIDDSSFAAMQAARLAREHGHAVTLFLNSYNISENKPYYFSRLSAALDATEVENVIFEGYEHDLRTMAAKLRFRSIVKTRLAQLGSEQDRQNFVSEIGVLLGIDEIVVPPWLQPITSADVIELAADGVDIQNHGWTHVLVGALPPEEYAAEIRRGRAWLHEICGAEADLFAVPNGDRLPLWQASPHYRAWLLLDRARPPGKLAPGLFNRRTLPA